MGKTLSGGLSYTLTALVLIKSWYTRKLCKHFLTFYSQYPQLFQAKPPDHDKESVMRKTFDYMNRQLQGQKYMAGDDMTLADISMATNLALLELRSYKLDQWPLLNAWYQRMKQLPYWAECNAGLYEWKNPMLSDLN